MPSHDRAAPRTTALGALTIFVPLFGVLLFWAFEHRVQTPWDWAPGMLSPAYALCIAAYVAATAALVGALFLANHRRLHLVFRPTRARMIAAVALVLFAPASLAQIPAISLWLMFAVLGAWAPIGFLALTLVCYPVACLVVSGIRNRWLRVAALVFVGWTGCFLSLLVMGWQPLIL